MNKIIHQFFLRLILFIPLIFAVHTAILSHKNLPFYGDKIVLSYFVNSLLAIAIFMILYVFRKKYRDQLGFLYMGGSLVKFALFFILFYPSFKADGKISGLEFASFFVPYITCLFLETLSLIKLLNSSEQNEEKSS
jgi:hypothetical protein